MTTVKVPTYTFVCDAPMCDEATGPLTPNNPRDGMRSVWRVVRREGWTRGPGDKHYCPGHRGHAELAPRLQPLPGGAGHPGARQRLRGRVVR